MIQSFLLRLVLPASRKRSTPIPPQKSAPSVSSSNKRKSASDDTPSTDKGIFRVGTKLRRRFHLSDFENTLFNLFNATHIWIDGEVTKIRYVNYRTQYTCAFKEGERSKVANEYDAENIEQWIRSYQRKHKVVPPHSPPPPRPPLLPPPAPKPTLASLLIPGDSFPTIQGTRSCSRETIFILNSCFPTYLLFHNPIVMSGLDPEHYAYVQHSSPHPLTHPHMCLHQLGNLRLRRPASNHGKGSE